MGLLSRLGWARGVLEASAEPGPTFEVDIDPVMLYGYVPSEASIAISPAARVSRRLAMQVPAVKRCRDIIAGTLGSLPVDLYDLNDQPRASALLAQPEPDVPRSVTMTATYEDMLFEKRAWWYVLAFDEFGYPAKVRRLDPTSVSVTPDFRVHVANATMQGIAEEWPSDARLIRFDSPNDGLLTAGARAIRTALMLDSAAQRYAEGAPPIDYFTPADPSVDLEDSEVDDVLTAWGAARRKRSTAYVPAALKYATAGWNPEQMQLHEARQHAVLEIARTAGVDPEELGVSTTSRTYSNQFDRRKQFTDFTLGGYRQAFEDRLRMGDVTPRGTYAKTNLSEFLRSDDKTRMEIATAGKDGGVLTGPEARRIFDPTLPADVQADVQSEEPVMPAAAAEPAETFDAEPAVRLDAPGAHVFEVDRETRTIRGMVVPYGKVAKSQGKSFRFNPRSLAFSDLSRVKLWISHDSTRAVGYMFQAESRPDGMWGAYRVDRSPEGDLALMKAEDKVWDGFSVGLGEGGRYVLAKDGVHDVFDVPWMETSLTPAPAFDDARVHSVAASAAHEGKEPTMGDSTTEQVAPETPPAAPDFAAMISEAVAAAFAQHTPAPEPAPERQVIPAAGGVARFEVNEGPLYRFDGGKGQHDFSADLIAGLGLGSGNPSPDGEAYQRVLGFMAAELGPKFVTTTDTAVLNPTGYRPDMYVNEQQFATPLRDAFYKGALTDVTPFTFPKFNAASGLVGDHTQGTEPTAGSFSTANGGTVTPAPVSGKVHITREVADQGGNPQVSGLIWNKIVYEFLKAMENKAAAMLGAAAPAELGAALAVGASTVANLAAPLEAAIAGLNFEAGGNRFNYAAAHIDLYLALAALKDGQQRPYYPIIAPSNASGTTVAGYKSLDVAGTRFDPVWSLGATSPTNPMKSYLADTSAVWMWHTAPQRLDRLQEKVEGYDLGVWGYWAGAISDITGVRKITYDKA